MKLIQPFRAIGWSSGGWSPVGVRRSLPRRADSVGGSVGVTPPELRQRGTPTECTPAELRRSPSELRRSSDGAPTELRPGVKNSDKRSVGLRETCRSSDGLRRTPSELRRSSGETPTDSDGLRRSSGEFFSSRSLYNSVGASVGAPTDSVGLRRSSAGAPTDSGAKKYYALRVAKLSFKFVIF